MKGYAYIEDILEKVDSTNESRANALKLLTDNFILIDIVDSILRNEMLQELIAKRSYNHTNGFFKIIIYEDYRLKVRLHVWYPTKRQHTMENIHYHRWKFASKIIIGEYKCFDYKIDQHGDLMNRYYYYPRNGKNEYEIIKSGQEYIKLVNSKVLKRNDILLSVPKELHRVVPNRNVFTASLLLQGESELEYTEIYSEYNNIEKTNISPSLSVQELKMILEDFKLSINI